MAISNLFRPKHRHTDAAVRAEAVRELGPGDAELLLEIARTDSDREVRRLAVERVDDPQLLVGVLSGACEPDLAELVRERASGLLLQRAIGGARAEAERALAEIERLDDQKALADVAAGAQVAEIRSRAVAQVSEAGALAELVRRSAWLQTCSDAIARLDEPELLRRIAMDERRRQVALLALDRITEPALLEEIAHKAKHKAVRARARRRLGSGRQSERPDARHGSAAEKRRYAERIQLVRSVEAVAERHEWVETLAEVEAAERAWAEIGLAEQDELSERFAAAVQRYRDRRARYGGGAASPPVAGERQKGLEDERDRIPEAELENGRNSGDVAAPCGAETARRKRPAAPAAATAAGEEDTAARGERESERRRALARLTQLCADVEAVAGAGKIRTIERRLHSAKEAFDSGADLFHGKRHQDLIERYERARKAALIRLGELREADEWERWANIPRREAIVRRAEELLADAAAADRAGQLKALQAEWKEAGPVPHAQGQEQWEKFRLACEQIYARIKEERRRLGEERSENLRRKRELCARLEELKDSTEWDETAEEIKKLQAEWRAIGPVARKHAEVLWKRFRAACDYFFARRKPHLEKTLAEFGDNLKRKEALCEEADGLAQVTDWEEGAAVLRQLQRRWRQIGPVSRKEAQAVTKRFHAACAEFFRRRDEARESERSARERDVNALCEAMRALRDADAGESGGQELVRCTLELRAQVLALGEVPAKLQAVLRDELQQLCRTMVERFADQFRGTELDADVNRKRKERLVARAEALVPKEKIAPIPESSTPEAIAARLRAALSENALGGVLSKRAPDGRPLGELIKDLRDSWGRLGPVPGPVGEDLEDRFRRACERTLAAL